MSNRFMSKKDLIAKGLNIDENKDINNIHIDYKLNKDKHKKMKQSKSTNILIKNNIETPKKLNNQELKLKESLSNMKIE